MAKVKLLSLESLENTSLKIGDIGEVICRISGAGFKDGCLISWGREIREGGFVTKGNCSVERNQLDFINV